MTTEVQEETKFELNLGLEGLMRHLRGSSGHQGPEWGRKGGKCRGTRGAS